jgi:hypothetical protein
VKVRPAVLPAVTAAAVISTVAGEQTAAGSVIVTVGIRWNVMLISSVDAVHGALLIVHRNTYAVPAVPVNVLVGLAGVATVPPKPLTILQDPVPTAGVFAARVVVVKPHIAAPV